MIVIRGRGNIEARVSDSRTHTVATLADRRIRQTHCVELFLVQLNRGKIDLYVNNVGIDSIHSSTKSFKKHDRAW